MKALPKIAGVLLMASLFLIFSSCQKDESISEIESKHYSEAKNTLQNQIQQDLNTEGAVNKLADLKQKIESLADDRVLSKHNANDLKTRIINALVNLNENNKTIVIYILNALINKLEALIFSGLIPEDFGNKIIHEAETVVIILNGSFIDPIDGYEYPVVIIGDQLWMAENLRATKYNDGTPIPIGADGPDWWQYDPIEPGRYCYYDNLSSLGDIYGALYNWHTVETGKLCPTGWHVPKNYEWEILVDFLGGWEVAGGKLKETGTTHWSSPNTGATNESGFTALPGGLRYDEGTFSYFGDGGYWWSATEWNWSADIGYANSRVSMYNENLPPYGLSVRCIRD